jgi:hypothetical protein
VRVTLPALAVIVATDEVVTDVVDTVNVALVAPAATVTLAGTLATVLLLESAVANPPDGAAAVSVTLPCDALPPTTVVGVSDSVDSDGPDGGGGGGGGAAAFTVSDVEALRRSSPEIVTAVSAVTDDVEIGNVALAVPAGTVTLAGTVAAEPELKSCTTAPPLGAEL